MKSKMAASAVVDARWRVSLLWLRNRMVLRSMG